MAEKILIVCGEASGELHAGLLTRELKKINPGLKVYAVGSSQLQSAGAEIIYDFTGLSVFGLFDALKKLPKFFALKKFLLNEILAKKFDAVILIDFSGFNLRLAKAINNTVPVFYYVSPQVWASRPGRVKVIGKFIKKMIVLFKFEEEFYRKFGIGAAWVGHPFLDTVKSGISKKELLEKSGLSYGKHTIALLPGSRKQEIKAVLPVMLKSCKIISKKIEAQFVIAKSALVAWNIYDKIIKKYGVPAKIVEGRTYDVVNCADFALVCSGTATLETAILQKPFAVIYKMGLLNYLLYRPQVKIPYIGMVNLVAGRKIVPEFIQFNARPGKIAGYVLKMLNDPAAMERSSKELAKISSSLGESGAAARAAEIIMRSL